MNIWLVLAIMHGAFIAGVMIGILLVYYLKARHEFIEKYYPEADADSE
jgi:hypothetical protein